jgi:branched-chain amino acid transport system permease protein
LDAKELTADIEGDRLAMLRFAQTFTDGLVLGGIYALSAAGFSLIFGVLHVLNLSHGVFVITGAYLAFALSTSLHIDPIATIPLVMVALFLVGYAYQRLLIQRVVDATGLRSMLLTFGIALMMENVLVWIFSPDVRSMTPSYAFASMQIGGLKFDLVRLSALSVSLVLLAFLSIMLRSTPLGRIIRATAQQGLAAQLCGVDIKHTFALTFAVSAAFAGAAGVAIGIMVPFTPSGAASWTLNAFIVVTLGGVGGPTGALVGGLVLGVIYNLTGQYIGPAYPNAMMFLVLVVVLVLRPNGLLGNAFVVSR